MIGAIHCLLLNVFLFCTSSATGMWGYSTRRKTGYLEGDIMFGALFSIHKQPQQDSAHKRACGPIWEQYGIQRVEATFQTIDIINANPNFLPGFTLGVEIRDTCWNAPIALEQSIEFIRDAIATESEGSKIPNKEICSSRQRRKNKHLAAVIGPPSSSAAIQVQNLLQLFNITQIGYSTTTRDLSDKGRYSYFLRVVPSDYYQAKVMVDIVLKYNWTYVSAVHTEGNYGQSGMQAFRELAEKKNVCIAKEDTVSSNAENAAFDEVIEHLLEDHHARVIVCFCEGMTVRGLFKAIERQNVSGHFLLIGSDGWADRHDVIQNLDSVAHGGISIRVYTTNVSEFQNHYFSLNATNPRNPWFSEFWEDRFNCTLTGREEKRNCTGTEPLSTRYKQDPKLSFVIKAIYALAHGLHNMHADICRGVRGLCKEMLPIEGSLLKEYLLNVTFKHNGKEEVKFDSRGDPPATYEIMNYQQLNDGSYDYVNIGAWNSGKLNMFREVHFHPATGGTVESVCAQPCPPGFKKNIQTGGQQKKCCWVCVPCEEYEYLLNETTCFPCQMGYWPTPDLNGCFQIDAEYLQWGDTEAIVAMVIASLGFLVTFTVMAVFIKHNNTPVVKASTRELTYIIFVGMCLCHLTTFPLIAQPTKFTCSVSRILPGLSFALIYASLMTKTNRIARILAGSKKKIMTRKPRFMSLTAQVMITTILISGEVSIIACVLILQPAEGVENYPTRNRVVLVCNTSTEGVLVPLGFDFLLIVMCTVYAIKTRNVPENFNEAKFIGFTMYTTCVIWIAFIPIYFRSDSAVITLALCISLSAWVAMVLLFFPKLYIIILRPEKNNRSAFTTSTHVRCHIGNTISWNSGASQSYSDYSLNSKSCPLPTDFKNSERKWGRNKSCFYPNKSIIDKPVRQHPVLIPTVSERTVDSTILPDQPERREDTHHSMLKRAYGSQIDLSGQASSPKTLSRTLECQTDDYLLENYLPNLRRRKLKKSVDRPQKVVHTPTEDMMVSAQIIEESASDRSTDEETSSEMRKITINLTSPESTSSDRILKKPPSESSSILLSPQELLYSNEFLSHPLNNPGETIFSPNSASEDTCGKTPASTLTSSSSLVNDLVPSQVFMEEWEEMDRKHGRWRIRGNVDQEDDNIEECRKYLSQQGIDVNVTGSKSGQL